MTVDIYNFRKIIAKGGTRMIHQFIMDNYAEHTFIILYFVNLILSMIAYKLGFAKKLPLLKSAFVYIILIIGMFILSILFFVVPLVWDMSPLPMTESLIVICLVLGIYRFRLHFERKKTAN